MLRDAVTAAQSRFLATFCSFFFNKLYFTFVTRCHLKIPLEFTMHVKSNRSFNLLKETVYMYFLRKREWER